MITRVGELERRVCALENQILKQEQKNNRHPLTDDPNNLYNKVVKFSSLKVGDKFMFMDDKHHGKSVIVRERICGPIDMSTYKWWYAPSIKSCDFVESDFDVKICE